MGQPGHNEGLKPGSRLYALWFPNPEPTPDRGGLRASKPQPCPRNGYIIGLALYADAIEPA